MRVTLKLFATYRRYLPPGSEGHACDLDVAPDSQVGDVIAQFGVPTDGAAVLLVNGRMASAAHKLREGDVLAAFPAMAGG